LVFCHRKRTQALLWELEKRGVLLWVLGLVLMASCTPNPSGSGDLTDAAHPGARDSGALPPSQDAGISDDENDAGTEEDLDGGRSQPDAGADSGVTQGTGPDGGEAMAQTSTHVVDGTLELRTPLSPWAADCDAGALPICGDLDQDTLSDAWEELVLNRFRPKLLFDENEGMFAEGHEPVLVGRVELVGADPLTIRVYLPILYPRDYGICQLTAHNGDSERVALQLLETDTGLRMEKAYTAAHEGAPTSQSRIWEGEDLAQLVFEDDGSGGSRWVVFPSRDKHATYATLDHCHGAFPFPCANESCFPDDVEDMAPFERVLSVHHVGEASAPLITDLGSLGFANEDAWLDQQFCGGLERGITCSGSVRSKLTENPF
jgi:hypothetical protein